MPADFSNTPFLFRPFHRLRHWLTGPELPDRSVVIFWNILGWVLYATIAIFPDSYREFFSWKMEVLLLLPTIVGFYVCLKSSFRLLSEGRLVAAVWTTLGLVAATIFVRSCLFFTGVKLGLPPYFDGVNVLEDGYRKAAKFSGGVGNFAYVLGYVTGRSLESVIEPFLLSFIYGYATQAVRYQTQLRHEQQRQQELVNEVTAARLQTLKYQINPHFLFNSLNFLYAQALPLSENLSRATLVLSEIMRYGLQETGDEAKVPLEQEVRHLQNFVEFNQLRFSNRLQVQFDVQGTLEYRRIMPLLLITFVENAFKYGELHDPTAPLRIELLVDSEALYFLVQNKKRSGPKENSTGIGLDNVRKRLSLAYPDRHSLLLLDEPTQYTASLTLRL